jgi:hypothetical protein
MARHMPQLRKRVKAIPHSAANIRRFSANLQGIRGGFLPTRQRGDPAINPEPPSSFIGEMGMPSAQGAAYRVTEIHSKPVY